MFFSNPNMVFLNAISIIEEIIIIKIKISEMDKNSKKNEHFD